MGIPGDAQMYRGDDGIHFLFIVPEGFQGVSQLAARIVEYKPHGVLEVVTMPFDRIGSGGEVFDFAVNTLFIPDEFYLVGFEENGPGGRKGVVLFVHDGHLYWIDDRIVQRCFLGEFTKQEAIKAGRMIYP